mgnify:CR=1 FL=1
MPKPFQKQELSDVISLLGKGTWGYFLTALIDAATIGFSFNLVLAFLKMDVLNAAVNGDQSLLTRALILAAVTFLTGVPILIATRYIIASYEKKAMTSARVQVFRQLTELPVSKFDTEHSGDLVSRSTNDLEIVGKTYKLLIPTLFFGLVMGLVGIIATFVLNWQMGIFALILGVATTYMSTTLAEPLREKSTAIQESLGALTERLNDLLQSLTTSKMFHLEETTHQLYAQANQQSADAAIAHGNTQALYDAINAFMNWMRSIGTLILGLYLLRNGNVALGAIAAAIHFQSNASFMFTNLGNFVTQSQRSLAGSARVFELLSWQKETAQPKAIVANPIPPTNTVIEIKDLRFSYTADDDEARPILDNITLSVDKGQIAALVGPSGGGKSTLVKILMGLYNIENGAVRINGKPLSSYPLEELRNLMAYVPQDAYLFDGTIEENIRYGRYDASPEDVITAAKAAHAHEFISEQPDGYETLVGERGAKLSGGQRQRIAIARALLKDAPILLLDEATSALDSESEALVQKALEVLMEGRTTIAIAHRLSTIEDADKIYILQDGKVIEDGAHEFLLEKKGVYGDLHR